MLVSSTTLRVKFWRQCETFLWINLIAVHEFTDVTNCWDKIALRLYAGNEQLQVRVLWRTILCVCCHRAQTHTLSLTALRFRLLGVILHFFMQPIRSYLFWFSSSLLLHSCQSYLTKRGEEASKDSCVAVFFPPFSPSDTQSETSEVQR